MTAGTAPVGAVWDLPDRGHWMQTFSGAKFWPLAPRSNEVHGVDIAHALAHVCRYGGHSLRFYSVAEHCVALSRAVSPGAALWALLHDAAEAYVGDMVRPLKRQLPEFADAEDRVLVAIADRFSLRGGIPAEVHEADNRIILTERAEFMAPTPDRWMEEGLEPLPVQLHGWTPAQAEAEYLQRLVDLAGEGAIL